MFLDDDRDYKSVVSVSSKHNYILDVIDVPYRIFINLLEIRESLNTDLNS